MIVVKFTADAGVLWIVLAYAIGLTVYCVYRFLRALGREVIKTHAAEPTQPRDGGAA